LTFTGSIRGQEELIKKRFENARQKAKNLKYFGDSLILQTPQYPKKKQITVGQLFQIVKA